MNEKIKELAHVAGYKHPDAVGACEDYAYFDHEKFADLILGECEDYLNSEIYRLCDYKDSLPKGDSRRDDVDICIEKCYDNIEGIKQHFGIKDETI